ncbi:hypothetical protein LSTR_LSTR014383 [Laodelphax striatellus]|uniref:Uncharacterized protein n=1 Tax=Laodelphax striatellus TaxID=195883 RepID=A0A482WSU2_LAOST|nr:hypothetical protein LSTR_LSTR014383 [Laodelphax striatellus]
MRRIRIQQILSFIRFEAEDPRELCSQRKCHLQDLVRPRDPVHRPGCAPSTNKNTAEVENPQPFIKREEEETLLEDTEREADLLNLSLNEPAANSRQPAASNVDLLMGGRPEPAIFSMDDANGGGDNTADLLGGFGQFVSSTANVPPPSTAQVQIASQSVAIRSVSIRLDQQLILRAIH